MKKKVPPTPNTACVCINPALAPTYIDFTVVNPRYVMHVMIGRGGVWTAAVEIHRVSSFFAAENRFFRVRRDDKHLYRALNPQSQGQT